MGPYLAVRTRDRPLPRRHSREDTETSTVQSPGLLLGLEGGEIMAMLQIAMMGKLPYTVLKDGVFAHPTLAESLNNLFGHFQN